MRLVCLTKTNVSWEEFTLYWRVKLAHFHLLFHWHEGLWLIQVDLWILYILFGLVFIVGLIIEKTNWKAASFENKEMKGFGTKSNLKELVLHRNEIRKLKDLAEGVQDKQKQNSLLCLFFDQLNRHLTIFSCYLHMLSLDVAHLQQLEISEALEFREVETRKNCNHDVFDTWPTQVDMLVRNQIYRKWQQNLPEQSPELCSCTTFRLSGKLLFTWLLSVNNF